MAAGGKAATYGELATEVDLTREAAARCNQKPHPSSWVGKSVLRRDIRRDDRRRLLRAGRAPARHGVRAHRASTLAWRATRLRRRGRGEAPAGVIAIVRDGTFLGVAAQREEQALRRATRCSNPRNGRSTSTAALG